MNLATARTLWGEETVKLALEEPAPEDPTQELAQAIVDHANPPEAFRAWSLVQPWPRFCAIVRIVSGANRKGYRTDNG